MTRTSSSQTSCQKSCPAQSQATSCNIHERFHGGKGHDRADAWPTYLDGRRQRALCSDVSLIAPGCLHVTGVDIVAGAISSTLQLDTRVLKGPDVVVSVLAALLDSGEAYCEGTLRRCRFDGYDGAGQNFLHPPLFGLLDAEEALGHELAAIRRLGGGREPARQAGLAFLTDIRRPSDRNLSDTVDEVDILTDVPKERIRAGLPRRHDQTTENRCRDGTRGLERPALRR